MTSIRSALMALHIFPSPNAFLGYFPRVSARLNVILEFKLVCLTSRIVSTLPAAVEACRDGVVGRSASQAERRHVACPVSLVSSMASSHASL